MKIVRIIAVAFMAAAAACSPDSYTKIKMEIPTETRVDITSYKAIHIAPFSILKAPEKFDIQAEMESYLSQELALSLQMPVSPVGFGKKTETSFEDAAFWQTLLPEGTQAAILAGTVEYSEETQKAIIESRLNKQETPFPEESLLSTRKFFRLDIKAVLIDAHTGKPVYQRTFKETLASKNANQTAPFAFFELIQRIKDKILADFSGGTKVQERYLINR